MSYTPPPGDLLPFALAGASYVAPGGSAVAFDMRYYPAYVPPDGNLVPLNFEGAYTPPPGNLVPLEFLETAGPPPSTQYVFPLAWDSVLFGSQRVRQQREYVRPSGFTHNAVSSPSIRNSRQYARPSSIAAPGAGTPSLMLKTRFVVPPGFIASVFGQPTIINRNRYVFAGNISAPLLGVNHQVFLYTRYLQVSGFIASGYGALTITHGRRFIQLASGIDAPPVGTLWISMSPRLVEPVGVAAGATGFPMVGGSRFITPQGWLSSAFGTRIIPESQSVFPQGFRELWGDTWVRNKRLFIKPPGFESNGQEQYRWGRAYLWNKRQYIIQTYDVDSALNPPPWSRFQSIANRNKVLGVSGITPPLPGFPSLFNNARLIQPASMLPPDYLGIIKRGMVSHRIRRLALEGIEPPLIARWNAIFNTARPLRPAPFVAGAVGQHALENTRRYFRYIGAFDASRYGTAFIAYRVRGISMEPRYAIQPPIIQLPEVKQHTRYIEPLGIDGLRVGLTHLQIHFTIIAPRWVVRDLFGEPFLRNNTPEVKTKGRNAEEFGNTFVRLQWRPVAPDGSKMELMGRPIIADRTQRITVPGNNMTRVGDKLVVTKTGAPPYSPQNIILEDDVGGIEWRLMMGIPSFNQSVLYPFGRDMLVFGGTLVENMGIRMQSGIPTDAYGEPTIQLKNRRVTVAAWPVSEIYEPPAPRLSPHTIYAVKEAPEQAKANHPPRDLHYVGETREYAAGERFGYPGVRGTYDTIRNVFAGEFARYGIPSLALRKRYLEPPSIRAYRFGWHTASDGRLFVDQFASTDHQEFGTPAIAQAPYLGPQTIKPAGMDALAIPATHWVALLHRTFQFTGFDSMAMGASRSDAPYQWQSLHVGVPLPTIPTGYDASAFGLTWVSLRVRDVGVKGFDSFRSEYDYEHFAARMRVRNATLPTIPAQGITAVGVDCAAVGLPNIKPKTHYIRPDGNSDQFRKGAW